MKVIISFILLLCLLFYQQVLSYDWSDTPLPTQIANNYTPVLNELVSDEFNYSSKDSIFNSKWNSKFFNGWQGPSKTIWNEDHTWFVNGKLGVQAHNDPNSDKILAGCLTSKNLIKFPVYVEAKVKQSDLSAMANCFWMLSEDNTQEIDILESYPTSRSDLSWYDQRIHLSHHVFIRNPFQDYQPRDEENVYGTWYYEKNRATWRGDYFTIGMFWRDSTHIEYYINGKWVRTLDKNDYSYLDENGNKKEYHTDFNIIDKYNYTGGTNLVKPMHVIIDLEQQSWLTDKNIRPTDEELTDSNYKNVYWVDWVRVYNLQDKTTSLKFHKKQSNILAWPNPANEYLYISANNNYKNLYLINSKGIKVKDIKNGENSLKTLPKGVYFIVSKENNKINFIKDIYKE